MDENVNWDVMHKEPQKKNSQQWPRASELRYSSGQERAYVERKGVIGHWVDCMLSCIDYADKDGPIPKGEREFNGCDVVSDFRPPHLSRG